MGNVFSEWLETYFDEVEPHEFYRGIFPVGELEERRSHDLNREEPVTKKYCGIAVAITGETTKDGKPVIKRYYITDGLEIIDDIVKSNYFCLCSPISYAGKTRTADNARFLYAIAIDLDRVRVVDGKPVGLMNLWEGHIELEGRIPKPTYIVSSGTGLHLYYVLDKPIPLFRDTAKQLQALKHDLTTNVWGYGIVDITDIREIQQEGIYQGFRMPGTITKTGSRARAFMTGDKVTIEDLNGYVSEGSRVSRYAVKKVLTKAKAKELYPEWYERRIVQGEPSSVWHISRNLYDWWKREILVNAREGHRYWCMMTLVVYARKCGMYDAKHNPNPVTREELEKDCREIMAHFENMTTRDDNHFTEADMQDALEAYEDRWIKYPRKTIEYRCGFELPHNKRNGRKQADHIKLMNYIREELNGNKDWHGRKSKKDDVELWQASHPDGTKADCIRDTGLSKPTVYKYWKVKA